MAKTVAWKTKLNMMPIPLVEGITGPKLNLVNVTHLKLYEYNILIRGEL